MNNENPLSSSELGALWLTYQEKTLILRVLEYFIAKADDQQAINIMGGLWQELHLYVQKIEKIFKNEGAVIPKGFTNEDVNLEAPKLFDNGFDIMFIRILKEISMGMYTINLNMAYRDDVMAIYEGLTAVTQKIYKLSTLYLLERGILTLPPNVTMPKSTEFIKSKSYLKGFKLFGDKRSLNDIELGYLHHGIETNNIGMQLITGFAQCADDEEVKQFFVKGKELAKKQIKEFEQILLESDVQFSANSGSIVTPSTIAPFSQKLMMFCVYLLNSFGIVGGSFGAVFSLRNDVILKTSLFAKDIFFYANDGIKIMIKNGWLEEPPQMEDRPQIIKGKNKK
ncbi:DUF3231 family protein [Cytobacillus solani]|uniref:Sugar isomerase n=1 Tax=Cytobacillus solani TaxID=1637975 RepID=A0A0Q3QQF7_9BACI|nr:DUF3231 family protein [Cytobacillus solani]KOP82934.1 hypothetical protein AMS60_10915 [Bacillus sp. FJAT-21945]KQL19958.1 hypothetical protein AN957_16220 [Cytobacillus solani]USK53201.1 DUF3231 family protein [Cytobacillus solani]